MRSGKTFSLQITKRKKCYATLIIITSYYHLHLLLVLRPLSPPSCVTHFADEYHVGIFALHRITSGSVRSNILNIKYRCISLTPPHTRPPPYDDDAMRDQ